MNLIKKRKNDEKTLKRIKESTLKEVISEYNVIQQYLDENFCKELTIIISDCLFKEKNNLEKVITEILNNLLEKTKFSYIISWYNNELILDFSFEGKASLNLIKDIWNAIQSSETFKCKDIEYYNKPEDEDETVEIKVELKK